ncbi:hypothetical protein COV22_03540, partial [Candidatus Woesearchaeota archaeon CG10_big_fil_rev_8_21_14_0_10_47_5]
MSAALPSDIPLLREAVEGIRLLCLEADIPFTRRYLIDKRITPMTLYQVEGEGVRGNLKIGCIEASSITPVNSDTLNEPDIIALDIETYTPEGEPVNTENPILMIGLYGKNIRKVITWKRFKTSAEFIEFAEDEAAMLIRLKELLDELKPDILTGYFSDGFDLPYIRARAEVLKLNLDLGIDYSRIILKKGAVPAAKITGMVHIDIFRFIRRVASGSLETQNLDLSSVARELLGEGKTEADISQLRSAWEQGEGIEPFCEYNLKDAELTFRLCSMFMPNITELVKLLSLTPFEVSRMSFSQLVEWHLISRAREFSQLIPNRPIYREVSSRMGRTYEGAFVFQPEPGLYKDIVVFDFRSLYPSIISSHNISPDTLRCECCKDNTVPENSSIWFCRKKQGFISAVIGDVIERRIRIKEIIRKSGEKQPVLDARQNALKLLANATYGYMGFFGARWYCLECAESIAAYGRHYIQDVIAKAQGNGFKVRYSDTDSTFISLEGKTKEQAEAFRKDVNNTLPELMELGYQGFYPRGIFVPTKGSSYGAKKKYALLSEGGSIVIKGFETVRRNLSGIAKEVQEEVLKLILRENDPEAALRYVQGVISKLRKKQVPVESLIIRTQLQKEIENYDSVTPHVAAAIRMKGKGISVRPGMLIRYVVIEGRDRIRDRVLLPEECRDNYDSDYYINNQVIPAVEKIFEVMG